MKAKAQRKQALSQAKSAMAAESADEQLGNQEREERIERLLAEIKFRCRLPA